MVLDMREEDWRLYASMAIVMAIIVLLVIARVWIVRCAVGNWARTSQYGEPSRARVSLHPMTRSGILTAIYIEPTIAKNGSTKTTVCSRSSALKRIEFVL